MSEVVWVVIGVIVGFGVQFLYDALGGVFGLVLKKDNKEIKMAGKEILVKFIIGCAILILLLIIQYVFLHIS